MQELAPACESGIGSIRRASITERLKHRKAALTAELAEVTAAVDALEENPGLQSLLDLVSRVA